MRTPDCIGIFILLRLHVFVRPFDFSVIKPPISDVTNYLKGSEICFIDNKPLFCPKASPDEATYNKPYAAYPGRESDRYNQASPDSVDPRVFSRPPLHNSPQKLHSSFQYQPSRELHGSLLYSRPLEHEHYNYGVTTVKDVIRPSSDYSISPSRDNVVAGSDSTTEHLFASVSKPDQGNEVPANVSLFDKFTRSLSRFERKFYQTTFNKFLSTNPPSRMKNGISFAQSGLFLYLALIALSMEVDSVSSAEIDSNLQLKSSNSDRTNLLRQITSWLPPSNVNLKFRWATRLVLEPGLPVSRKFLNETAPALRLHVEWLNGTETLGNLTKTLNKWVKTDSGGAMRNTFEEDDFTDGVCSILLNTVYVRARWRSPPTVLNDSRPFRDSEHSEPERSVRMIRINDVMRYAAIKEWNAEIISLTRDTEHTQPERSVRIIRVNDVMRYAALKEWNAEAIEIRYATPGLTLLLLVPEGHTLKSLATNMATTSLRKIDGRLRKMRVAAILPIYTLRMILLLPGKLQAMGISRLVETNSTKSSRCGQLRLSHAVQRIMFWAEAGRNAYKDDGIEWDEAPEKEIIVDRPYLFYVRWKNVTLMNGNFVL